MNYKKELTTPQLIKTAKSSIKRLTARKSNDELLLTEVVNRLEVLYSRIEAMEAFNEVYTNEFDEEDW